MGHFKSWIEPLTHAYDIKSQIVWKDNIESQLTYISPE